MMIAWQDPPSPYVQYAEEDAALVDAARFLAARCQTASEQYPAVVIADGDEATTAVQVIDRIIEAL